MNEVDLDIPLRWGHIAGKLYGDPSNQHVFVTHGILDNLGSMTRLIQLLPNNFYYISIDLPGHGRSSPLPNGMLYNTLDNLLVYRAVLDYFPNRKFILIGHSWGAQLELIFAHLYPERVTRICMLDALCMMPHYTGIYGDKLVDIHNQYFSLYQKMETRKKPEYEYETALNRIMNFRSFGVLNREGAKPVLERQSVSLPNGKIQLTSDQRLKFFLNPPIDFKYWIEFMKQHPIRCPVKIILADESVRVAFATYFQPVLEYYLTLQNFEIVIVEGNHDVHNAYPERVASHVTSFLLSCKL